MEVKPWYTLGELAVAAKLSRRRVLRILRDNGVRMTPRIPVSGKRIWVSHNALVQAFPDFLQTIAACWCRCRREESRW
jgi:hypothetical protein